MILADVIEPFWSELPVYTWKGQPCPPPQFNQFSPPEKPITVHCLHCGLKYDSRLIAWGRKAGMEMAGDVFDPAIWWCPTPVCDGGGFHHDIYEIGKFGGRNAKPLTPEAVAKWQDQVKNRGCPKTGKAKYAEFLRRDAIHNEWLLARMASIRAV